MKLPELLSILTSKLGRDEDLPLAVTETGFEYGNPSIGVTRVSWEQIVRIEAYKLDLLTWDEVRMRFTLADGSLVEVSEEQPGFPEFEHVLAAQFPTTSNWRDYVIQPAFARNETVLFVR